MIDQRLLSLFSDITSCPSQCPRVVNNKREGIIPRSFYCEVPLSDVTLLIVGKNPANAPDWERELNIFASSDQLPVKHLAVVRDLFTGERSVPGNFHANVLRRVAVVLGVSPVLTEVFHHAAMTALAKCQSAGDKTAPIPAITFETCASRFLFREIQHYKPCYLVALGDEVYSFLNKPSVRSRHGLPVGKVWHPSWSNMPGGEDHYLKNDLMKLHMEYKEAVCASTGKWQHKGRP